MEEEGGIALYAYAFNNPIAGFDTDGREPRLVNIPRDFVGGLFTIVRGIVGVPISIASGDFFDRDGIVTSFPADTCKILITIAGVRSGERQAEQIRVSASQASRYQGALAVAVRNGTHLLGVGDLVQVVGQESGAIDVTAMRAAKQIEAAREALKRNKCRCGCIYVLAHSQGSMIFNRALPILSEKTRSLISYTGVGSQKAIQTSWGLGSVENYANEHDFVAILGNKLNPFRLFDLPQMIHGQQIDETQSPNPSWFEHVYQTHYQEFMESLPNRCPLKPVE